MSDWLPRHKEKGEERTDGTNTIKAKGLHLDHSMKHTHVCNHARFINRAFFIPLNLVPTYEWIIGSLASHKRNWEPPNHNAPQWCLTLLMWVGRELSNGNERTIQIKICEWLEMQAQKTWLSYFVLCLHTPLHDPPYPNKIINEASVHRIWGDIGRAL